MTSVGHSVRSEESQSHVKLSLPSWDVTRELTEVKIADIEEPKERRESCNDVAKKPIMNGVAEETTESCDDIASEPVIPREATQIVVEDMVKMSIEVGADRAKKPTLVGVADVERVDETAELSLDAASEPVIVMDENAAQTAVEDIHALKKFHVQF